MLPLNEIFNAAGRHTLEHFDEYLDKAAIASVKGRIPRPTLFPMDMFLSSPDTLKVLDYVKEGATVHPMRVYMRIGESS